MCNKKNISPILIKLIVLIIISSLLASCASKQICKNGDCIPGSGGLSTPEQVGVGIGAAIGAALLGYLIDQAVSEDGNNPEDPNWNTNGPVVPEYFNFSDLKIGGYAKGEWPVAVDYQLSRPGTVVLVVRTKSNDKPFIYQLDGTSTNRQLKILNLPETFGDTPVRAIFEIHATENANGINKLVPINIFGIACGAKAVDSIGIDQIDFGPGNIKTSLGELAHHAFFAHRSFSKVQEEFRKIEKTSNGANEPTLVGKIVNKNVLDPFTAIDESIGQMIGKGDPAFIWDGKTDQKQISKGFHQLQIRAWYVNDKDWVTAFSPGQVDVNE